MKNITIVALQKNGGGPVDALEMSNSFIQKQAKHTLIISDENELGAYFTDQEFRKVIRIKTSASKKSSLVLATITLVRPLRLFNQIIKSNPDIILSPFFHPWLFIISIYKFFKDIPWFYAIYESPFWEKENRGNLEKKLEVSFLKKADVIVCYSNFLKKNISEKMPGKKIINIPIGAYVSAFAISIKNYVQIPAKEKTRISVVGRIETHKGIETLIESFKILRKENLNFELLIAGKGILPANTPTADNLILMNKWLTLEEIGHIYKSSDAIVIPYWNASQSGSPAWSAASGKPVIATRTGGVPEQMIEGETGFVVSPKDPVALAEAIKKIVSDTQLRNQMSVNMKKFGEEKQSWGTATQILLGEFNSTN